MRRGRLSLAQNSWMEWAPTIDLPIRQRSVFSPCSPGIPGSPEKLTLSLVIQETVNLGGGTVVGANGEAVVGNVQNQVLAHDGQTDEAEISTRNRVRRSADIDAGETGAIVSDQFLVNSWVNITKGR